MNELNCLISIQGANVSTYETEFGNKKVNLKIW